MGNRSFLLCYALLSPRLIVQASNNLETVKDLVENFKLGQRLECYVVSVSTSPASLDLSVTAEGVWAQRF